MSVPLWPCTFFSPISSDWVSTVHKYVLYYYFFKPIALFCWILPCHPSEQANKQSFATWQVRTLSGFLAQACLAFPLLDISPWVQESTRCCSVMSCGSLQPMLERLGPEWSWLFYGPSFGDTVHVSQTVGPAHFLPEEQGFSSEGRWRSSWSPCSFSACGKRFLSIYYVLGIFWSTGDPEVTKRVSVLRSKMKNWR